MKKLSSNLPNMLLALVGVCIVVSGLLATLNYLTKKSVEDAKTQAKVDAIRQVIPQFDNNPLEESFSVLPEESPDSLIVYPARQGESLVGMAIETYSKNGFGGPIVLMMGLDTAGTIFDYSVLEIAETPGLGSLIPEWFHQDHNGDGIRNVCGLNLSNEYPLKVTKDGGRIDAITAATISSRAFLEAINLGYEAFRLALVDHRLKATE